MTMKLKQFMSTNVCTVPPSTTYKEVSRLMADRKVGSVVVVDDANKMHGIVTQTDVVSHVAAGLDTSTPVIFHGENEMLTAKEDMLVWLENGEGEHTRDQGGP